MLLGELADDPQRVVEVPLQGDDAGAVHQRLGELADRDLALGDDHRPAQARPAPRRRRQLAAVLPVEAQITASAPRPFARETATVIPRSLNEPVGFSPSNLR